MADYVRSRMTATKIGIGLALGVLIGGVGARVRTEPARVNPSPAGDRLKVARKAGGDPNTLLKVLVNMITSKQIKDHSLLYKDFKPNQVVPFSKLKDISAELDGIKGESADHKHKDTIEIQSLNASLASLSAKVRDQVIQGHGNVFSGMQDVGTTAAPKQLLSVPEWITVQGHYMNIDSPAILITNVASYSIAVTWNDGKTEHQDTIAPNGGTLDLPFPTGEDLITAQLLSNDGRPITLTLSRIADSGGQSSRFVAQALATGG